MSTTKVPSPEQLAQLSLKELPDNLCDFGYKVLTTNDTIEKAILTQQAFKAWNSGQITKITATSNRKERIEPPLIPARPKNLQTVAPKDVPKRGAGSVQNRVALLHSISHMESYAIDLSWDILVRFACLDFLPVEYFEDWLRVADDEARHFFWLENRLMELGSFYGDLPGK